MGRYRDRTFTGCWTCRARKVKVRLFDNKRRCIRGHNILIPHKCDEGKPTCSACNRLGLSCQGYAPKLVWIEGSNPPYRSDGRRHMRCDGTDLTWSGYPTLPSPTLEYFITEFDDSDHFDSATFNQFPPKAEYNPFPVLFFEADKIGCTTSLTLVQNEFVPRLLAQNPDLNWTQRFLFHHYTSHVANLMMPYEHPRNPWTCQYPAAALQNAKAHNKALLHSLLAQSAFNVARLRDQDQDMIVAGSKSYASALRYLRSALKSNTAELAAMFASTMTLLMAETYLGQTQTWRLHIKGAWNIFQSLTRMEGWIDTDFTCVSAQSLYIIKFLSDTSKRSIYSINQDTALSCPYDRCQLLWETVSSTDGFGFTLGASRMILECISSITDLDTRAHRQETYGLLEEETSMILEKLSELHTCSTYPGNSPSDAHEDDPQATQCTAVQNQEMAFVYATYIHLYRTIYNLPPVQLRHYINRTFQHVEAFFKTSNRNFSVWPAFIAAVEAYTDQDIESARTWLDRSTKFGMANRDALRKVVEEVWRRREDLAASLCIDPGAVVVDWRDVIEDLDCDVLLV